MEVYEAFHVGAHCLIAFLYRLRLSASVLLNSSDLSLSLLSIAVLSLSRSDISALSLSLLWSLTNILRLTVIILRL